MFTRPSCCSRSRRLIAIVRMLALAAALLVLPGCGGMEGTYVATDPDGGGGKLTVELKADDVLNMSISGPDGMNITQSGTWKVEGGKVIINVNGNREELTIKGGTLIANFLGETMELKKQ